MNFFKRIINRFRKPGTFVTLDPVDSSVTLSPALFAKIKKAAAGTAPKVFVFRIPLQRAFGFMLDPELPRPSQLADIQYNSKHNCIGFESLNPTVARILYDYGINALDKPCRLTVTQQRTPTGQIYFRIEPPLL